MMELNTKQFDNLKEFLFLSDNELIIYKKLLSFGNSGTLGQISMLSGLDIISTRQILQTLKNRGFVREFKGIVNRYIALEPFLEGVINSFDSDSFQNLIDVTSKILKNSSLSLIDDESMFKDYIGKKLQERMDKILNNAEFDNDIRELIERVLHDALGLINSTAYSIVTDMEARGKKALEMAAKQFENNGSSFLAALSSTQGKIKELFEISRQISEPEDYTTELFIGEGAVLLAMRDFIPRTEQSILLFMPIPDPKSLLSLIDLSNRRVVDINVVGNLQRAPKSILNKVKDEGVGIKMHQNETIDFWGVIKDNNELLMAPMPEKKEIQITGVYTSKLTLVNYFDEHLRKYTRFASNV